jgi:hypothetical protein
MLLLLAGSLGGGCGSRELTSRQWKHPVGALVAFPRPQGGFGVARVLRAERVGDGGRTIVHLSVFREHPPSIAEARRWGGTAVAAPLRLAHLPVLERVLDDAHVVAVGLLPLRPGELDGYDRWRREYARGRATVFDRPLAELVTMVEQTPLRTD